MSEYPRQPLPSGVEPIPREPFRFYVQSRSRKGHKWLVDIEESMCGCEDHEFNVATKLRRGEPAPRCWHLQQARDFFLDTLILLWGKTENNT